MTGRRRVQGLLRRAVGAASPGGRGGDSEPDRVGRVLASPEARLLAGTPLFDDDWYSRTTGVGPRPRDLLVADYLARPVGQRPAPHPLFLREHVALELRARLGGQVADRDELLVYLRRAMRFPTHPLFDVESYVQMNRGARRHPGGAFGHYLASDPGARAPGATWLPSGRGLQEWVEGQHDAWRERHRDGMSQVVPAGWLRTDTGASRTNVEDEVLVVVEAGRSRSHLEQSLESVAAQTHDHWRVLVADPGLDGCHDVLTAILPPERWTRLDVPSSERRWTLSPALEVAAGEQTPGTSTAHEWVAVLRSGEVWVPGRLAGLLDHALSSGSDVACDVLEETRRDGTSVLLGRGMPAGDSRNPEWAELSRLLIRRAHLRMVGVPDPGQGRGWEFDLVRRLAEPSGISALRRVGSRRAAADVRAAHRLPADVRPRVPEDEVPSVAHQALARRLVDWAELGRRPRRPGLTSVVVVTYRDWRMSDEAVTAVLAAADSDPDLGEVEVIVVDNGCGPQAAAVLASWPLRDPRVKVVHEPVNHGFGNGSNLGFAASSGDVVVFLNNDTTVDPGWLRPLRGALADPQVLGAQPLLLYPTGTIQCAGVMVPEVGGMPYPVLRGFPVQDAAHLGDVRLPALTGAALALRADDVIELEGFDPLFLNGMEDIDLCLRLSRSRPGHFTCRPEAVVVHHESRTPGRFRHLVPNRRLYLERWDHRTGAEVETWQQLGYDVVGYDTPEEGGLPRDTWVTQPILRRHRLAVTEGAPRLRWAIKNPAPATSVGDLWGDTHFADALAAALRGLGQEVVVDRRQEHTRPTGRHDDVELVLRGLAPYRPVRHNVSFSWVISHPNLVSLSELAGYDRVFAASEPWARQRSEAWGIPIEPMLQATDPSAFHPDRAVPDTGHPVLFVGSSRRTTRPLVDAAVEKGLPLSIYGREWEGLVDPHYVKATYLPNDRLGAAYRSAGVVLNDHWEDMRRDGFVSNRLFDAAAAGARVVTDDVEGLPDVFGRSVQVAQDGDDLVRLTSLPDPDSVFGSDAERRSVAAEVARMHSFTARAARLLDVAVETCRERGHQP